MNSPEPDQPVSRVPEPALVRSVLVAITGVIALIIGHAIDVSWINPIVDVYAALSPIIAGILIRPAVRPIAKISGKPGKHEKEL